MRRWAGHGERSVGNGVDAPPRLTVPGEVGSGQGLQLRTGACAVPRCPCVGL